MLVARIHGAGDVRLHDEPLPTPGPGEVLVKVTAVGICGSDIHWFREGRIGHDTIRQPLVLGHECAGIIESGPRKGQHVAIDPAIPCFHCEYCQEGNPNLCAHMAFAGHAPKDGAMSEYIAWPDHCLFTLPPGLSDAEGAMLEPLGVGMYSVDLSNLGPGMSVGVFGCGPIGLSIIQMARAAGATRIYATDLPSLPHRLEAARAAGAIPVPVNDGKEAAEIRRATGRGVDVAFDASGDPGAVEAAITAAKPGGQAILVGIPCEDRTSFTASTARGKDLTIKVVHRMKHTYPRCFELATSGRVELRSMITHRFPLRDVAKAFASAEKREGLKVLIEC